MKKNILSFSKNKINKEKQQLCLGGEQGGGSCDGGCLVVICFDNCLEGGSRSSEHKGQAGSKRGYRNQAVIGY